MQCDSSNGGVVIVGFMISWPNYAQVEIQNSDHVTVSCHLLPYLEEKIVLENMG